MGSTGKKKYLRTDRKIRSTKPEFDQLAVSTNENGTGEVLGAVRTRKKTPATRTIPSDAITLAYQNPTLDLNSMIDARGWGYCSDEELEGILLKKLEVYFNEALNKFISLGYDKEVVFEAILRANICFGPKDVWNNIMSNSLVNLSMSSGGGSDVFSSEEQLSGLKQLGESSLKMMVDLLQDIRPHLSKADALWFLLMTGLHAARACVMEVPLSCLPSEIRKMSKSVNGCENALSKAKRTPEEVTGSVEPVEEVICTRSLPYGSEMALQTEIECPKRFNLSPSMMIQLKRNVAMFAAGFRANYSDQFQSQSHHSCSNCLCGGEESRSGNGTSAVAPISHKEESQYAKNQDEVGSIMSKFQDLDLGDNSPLDEKDEMIMSLVHQIKDLEKQLKERKEWAQQKAIQAAKKLGDDLIELKLLKANGAENKSLIKKGKQTLDDSTMKKLSEMETALRKASGEVERTNAAVRKLETENEEIRAEIMASTLDASESAAACLEVVKREKKCLKKILAGEKQKTKVLDDIATENQKISILQKELDEIEADTKAIEAKWREEQKSNELLRAQVEEEKRLKEDSDANNKRKIEALRSKIDMDFQCQKDDLQRLEQEYACLKESAKSTQVDHKSKRTLTKLATQGEIVKDASCDRACMICKKNEVYVVFLPCAHQIMCAGCSDNYGKKGKAVCCPYCRVPIEQRIRVYGPASS